MTAGDGHFRLPDGRGLAYAESGDPSGFPVFAFHGNPGSRMIWTAPEVDAVAAGCRVIAPDRPGFGGSDPRPGLGFADWPQDVAALADHLGIDTFGVLGASGGGPFALACAWRLPERVRAAGLIATGPPAPQALRGAGRGLRLFLLARYFAWPVRRRVNALAAVAAEDPDAWVQQAFASCGPADRALVKRDDMRRLLGEDAREAFRQGGQGGEASVHELILYARPWPMPLSEIRTKALVWHGREDSVLPIAFAEHLAAELPNCRAEFVEGAGHLWYLDRRGEILSALAEAARETP